MAPDQGRPARQVALNGLYALAGALIDVHWNDLPADLKEDLRREAESG